VNKVKIKAAAFLKKCRAALLTSAFMSAGSISASAATTTTTDTSSLNAITTFLSNVASIIKTFGFWISIIMFCLSAILMMTGTEGSQKAKKWFFYICLGLMLLFFAVQVATQFQNMANNS
jgi:hypothetical protein